MRSGDGIIFATSRRGLRAMTNQYEQPSINQQEIQVVDRNTESLDPIFITLGTLDVDGTGLAMQFFGGGLDPSNAGADAYTLRGTQTIVREGGVILIGVGNPIVTGGAGAPTIAVIGSGNRIIMRLTPGTASLYLHRMNIRRIPIG